MSLLSYTTHLIETRQAYLKKNKVNGDGHFVHSDEERLLANAKAEQCLDDLYYLYTAIKDVDLGVAEMIKDSMKGTFYMMLINGPDDTSKPFKQYEPAKLKKKTNKNGKYIYSNRNALSGSV